MANCEYASMREATTKIDLRKVALFESVWVDFRYLSCGPCYVIKPFTPVKVWTECFREVLTFALAGIPLSHKCQEMSTII